LKKTGGFFMVDSLKAFIRDVPDFPKPGIIFKDITPLLQDKKAFNDVINLLVERYKDQRIEKIVGIDARGFIFAAALAYALETGMVPVRKVNKLPYETFKKTYELEYGTDAVEIHKDAINKGERVIIIDDLLATGGTLAASCQLVEQLGADIVEVVTLIELTFLAGREKLKKYKFYSMMEY
jgi:adenine phosphoribosyltransferase